jgi:hypothetical protein
MLWMEDPWGSGIMAMLVFPVESSNLSGGFAAVEQGLFLAVTPKMVQDASGEAPGLMVRIDKAAALPQTAPLLEQRGPPADSWSQQRRGPGSNQNLAVRLIFCMYKQLVMLNC